MRFLILILITTLAFAQEAKLVPLQNEIKLDPKQATFDSKQKILVRGSNSAIRNKIFHIASNQRKELYKLLEIDEDSQKSQLVIDLYGKEGDKPPARLVSKGFTLHQDDIYFNLSIHLARGIHESQISSLITQLLIHEIGVRDHKFDPNLPLELNLNPWLIQGVRQAILQQAGKTDRQLYARLFEQQSIYPLNDLINRKDGDHTVEIIDVAFEVSSGALVMALINQPQGKRGLLNLIKEASTFEGEQRILLTKNFPESTLSKNSLAKWWALQLANMSKRPAQDLLTIALTEAQLKEALIVRFKDKEGIVHRLDPENYYQLEGFKKHTVIHSVSNTYNQLSQLQSRAFPSYRPLISGYQQLLFSFLDEKEKKTFWSLFKFSEEEEINPEEMLKALTNEREIMVKLGERTTDYLNWYQVEQPTKQTGEFENFLRIVDEIQNYSETNGGHISHYLDDIEKLYEK